MATIKATMFFEFGELGWSDSFLTGNYTGVDLAVADAVTLTKARYLLCPKPVQLIGVRVSDVNVFRDSRFVSYIGMGSPPNSNYAAGLDPSSCLLIRFEATPLFRRIFELRGVPENIVTGQPVQLIDPLPQVFKNYLAKFTVGLTGGSLQPSIAPLPGNWGIWGEAAGLNPVVNINAMTILPDFKSLVLTMATQMVKVIPPGPGSVPLAVNDYIIITRTKGAHGVNGIWQISTAATAAPWIYTLRSRNHLISLPTSAVEGVARALVKTVIPFDKFSVEGMSERKVGRPFGLRRGRREAIQ